MLWTVPSKSCATKRFEIQMYRMHCSQNSRQFFKVYLYIYCCYVISSYHIFQSSAYYYYYCCCFFLYIMSLENSPRLSSKSISVGSISVPLPVFNSRKAELWFACSRSFLVANWTTSQSTKLSYANLLLPDDVIEQVSDVIFKPDTNSSYSCLRREVIRVTSLIDQQTIDQPLVNVELGESISFQLNCHMTDLLGNRVVDKRSLYW